MSAPRPDRPDAPARDSDLCERLEGFLRARLGADAVRVAGLSRHTEGFSQETFAFDAEIERGGERERRGFVVKRAPPAGLLEPYDLEPEFRVLHALAGEPLRAPAAHWFERDPAVLERPFYVMDRLGGEVALPVSGPDGSGPFDDAERARLGPEVADELARLHAVDWRARGLEFLDPPAPGREAAQREVARWQARVTRTELTPPPPLAEALGWLRSAAPESPEVVLLHGDFRLGNLLVERGAGGARLRGVLDWEMVHLGDPLEDLAWCASPMWMAQTGLASGLLPPDAFAAAYARAAGREVDPERLHFYGVLAVVKMMAIMLTGIRAFRDGRTHDLRMAIFDHQLVGLAALLGGLRGWLSEAAC